MSRAVVWSSPRRCSRCGHPHQSPAHAKATRNNGRPVYRCTWCADLAPPLRAARQNSTFIRTR